MGNSFTVSEENKYIPNRNTYENQNQNQMNLSQGIYILFKYKQ
jgi:hypothetical protein